MRSALREELIKHLELVSELMDRYASMDATFVDGVADWLAELEKILQKYRVPSASLAATERGKLLSVRDGRRDAEVVDPAPPVRKRIRAVAVSCLARVEATARERVETIDRDFDEMRGKIAQLLAISSSRSPIPMPPTEPRTAWLVKIWKGLDGGETKNMYAFINASLPLVDRLYLLDGLLDNLLELAEPRE